MTTQRYAERLEWSGKRGNRTVSMVSIHTLTVDGDGIARLGNRVGETITRYSKQYDRTVAGLDGDLWGFEHIADGERVPDKILARIIGINQ